VDDFYVKEFILRQAYRDLSFIILCLDGFANYDEFWSGLRLTDLQYRGKAFLVKHTDSDNFSYYETFKSMVYGPGVRL